MLIRRFVALYQGLVCSRYHPSLQMCAFNVVKLLTVAKATAAMYSVVTVRSCLQGVQT